MSKNLNFDYYYGNEANQFQFFMIPRAIISDMRFDDISLGAKVLYGLMLDRSSLSIKSKWLDENNRVYIIYTIETIQKTLRCSKNTASKCLKELDSENGIGLIERKKRGMGKPDIIYVKNFITGKGANNTLNVTDNDFVNPKTCTSNVAEDIADCSENNSKSAENHVFEPTLVADETDGVDFVNPKTCASTNNIYDEICESQNLGLLGSKIRIQESQILTPNHTNINNTKLNYTNQSNHINQKEEDTSDMTDMTNTEIENDVLKAFKNEETLPYEYTQHKYCRHLTKAIHLLTNYDFYKSSETYFDGRDDCYFSTVHIFNECLIKMLSSTSLRISGGFFTYAKIYDKLVPHIEFLKNYTNDAVPTIERLMVNVIANYQTASKNGDGIKYPIPYMMSCILSGMEEGDAKIQDAIRHDFQV